jgi:uncharacterized protein YbjQ (UPF0145 family)
MGFFDFLRGNGERAAQKAASYAIDARQKQSEDSLKRGGLPLHAVERLLHQRAMQTSSSHLWTSDLSVSELSLVHDAGYEPLGQVMGASIYHVGFQWNDQIWRHSWRSGSLDDLSVAFANARKLALGRLQQEAQILGAEGVVGVRVQQKSSDWSGDAVEFQAIGTAIRSRHSPPPIQGTKPFLCALSGQDFWKLKQSGVTPVGLVAGNCNYYCIPRVNTQKIMARGILYSSSWVNQEFSEFTLALSSARRVAIGRLRTQAKLLEAHGTVGMTIECDSKTHHVEVNDQTCVAMLYHFLAMGTAVRVESRAPQTTKRVLSLEFIPVHRDTI